VVSVTAGGLDGCHIASLQSLSDRHPKGEDPPQGAASGAQRLERGPKVRPCPSNVIQNHRRHPAPGRWHFLISANGSYQPPTSNPEPTDLFQMPNYREDPYNSSDKRGQPARSASILAPTRRR